MEQSVRGNLVHTFSFKDELSGDVNIKGLFRILSDI